MIRRTEKIDWKILTENYEGHEFMESHDHP